MASININTGVADDFYRYKMPKLLAKVEGKGNGIKTVIVNMPEVAKSLHRPPSYSTKFFGCELGAQVQMDAKNERYIVNGAHDAPKLQGLLDGFIKRYVLCAECGNPETNLEVTKKQTINQICIACGHRGMVDMRHKLTTFILKNPPSADGMSSASAATPGKTKAEKRKSGKGKRDDASGAVAGGGSTDADDPQSPGVMNGVTSLAQVKERDGDKDDDWSVDTSADAVKQRQTTLSMAAASLAITDDLELSEDDRLERLYSFVSEEQLKGNFKASNRTVFEEAKRLEVLDKGVFIVCEILFDDSVIKQLEEFRRFLLQFLHGNKKAQKHFLGAVEKLAGKKYPALLARIPLILKACYDLDLVEEEVFIDWHDKVSKKYVDRKTAQAIRDKAGPFVKWLREAETESESEDDDGVEVVYTHKSPAQILKEEQEKKKAEAVAAGEIVEEEVDDLDIDNI